MKTQGNTILVTGGTSGIGLEMATQFLALGNTVVITGRNPERLSEALRAHPGLHGIRSDVAAPEAIARLHADVTGRFPRLNMLVNNAGEMRKLNLQTRGADLRDITRELETNLSGPVRMVQQFLPHLAAQAEAAIVNVSSGLAYVPFPIAPVYSATKAGLHAYTRCLRVQLKHTRIRVFELAPPATRTPLIGIFTADVGEGSLMPVDRLARAAIRGIARDRLEIRPGLSLALALMGRIAPEFALRLLSRPVDAMLESGTAAR